MNTNDIINLENIYTSGLYTKRPLAISHGQGARLWDTDGKMYIDCVGGQGAANLGHANLAVANAISKQASELISCPEMFYNHKRALLERTLVELTGLRRVFLCNSGAEANEAAIKFARVTTGRIEIVAAMRGFHGRTLGALSATWEKKYREPFEPLVPGFFHFPYNDLNALDAVVSEKTAAVLLEVVQGEGGVRPGSLDFLLGAQQICQERGALLVIDEVQTGMGRTGRMFAYQHYDLKPDIVCLAKSLAGGVPIGAAIIGEKLGELPAQVHGSTFGGNPLACAAALAAINELQSRGLIERAKELGDWFRLELLKIHSPMMREVRGLGLMVGIELKQKVTPFLQSLMERGILALPAGLTVMRFLPPLVISKDELQEVVMGVTEVLLNGESIQ